MRARCEDRGDTNGRMLAVVPVEMLQRGRDPKTAETPEAWLEYH